jgi:hypothetical protein
VGKPHWPRLDEIVMATDAGTIPLVPHPATGTGRAGHR